MRSLTALFALALLPLAAPLAAQSHTPAASLIEQLRHEASHGEVRSARRAAEAVVREGRDGLASVEALLFLAQMDHADGRRMRAADALDRAAVEAAKHGDPVAQTRALLDAATIYVSEGQMARAAARVEQLRPLLRSPYLPAELRAEAEGRLNR